MNTADVDANDANHIAISTPQRSLSGSISTFLATMSTIDIHPTVQTFRDAVFKDKVLSKAIVWGPNDRDTRLRLHKIVCRMNENLLFDPAYTAAMQHDDMRLQKLCGVVEEILVANLPVGWSCAC